MKHIVSKSHQKRITFKICLTATLFFLGYLIVLPLILRQIVPCLGTNPLASYTDGECNVARALDVLMILALSGFVVVIVTLFLVLSTIIQSKTHKFYIRKMFPLLTTALIMTAIFIVTYELNIPVIEKTIRTAPIILESLKVKSQK